MTCKGCDTPIPPSKGGPARIWCSDRCRKQTLYGGRCEDCGSVTSGTNGKAAAPKVCGPCLHEREYGERNRRLFEMWERGMASKEIAAEVGTTQTNVLSLINYHRRHNGEPITARHLSHDPAAVEARRKLILKLIREGRTNPEIAEQIGTTSGSVAFMVQVMRQQGWELPQRSTGNRRKVGTA